MICNGYFLASSFVIEYCHNIISPTSSSSDTLQFYNCAFESKININFFTRLRTRLGGGGNLHMTGVGMLVVSLRGVKFRFWSHLGSQARPKPICGQDGLI